MSLELSRLNNDHLLLGCSLPRSNSFDGIYNVGTLSDCDGGGLRSETLYHDFFLFDKIKHLPLPKTTCLPSSHEVIPGQAPPTTKQRWAISKNWLPSENNNTRLGLPVFPPHLLVVMKNCDPLVFLPELAMERRYFWSCFFCVCTRNHTDRTGQASELRQGAGKYDDADDQWYPLTNRSHFNLQWSSRPTEVHNAWLWSEDTGRQGAASKEEGIRNLKEKMIPPPWIRGRRGGALTLNLPPS